ncbi:copper-binding protein [Roseibium sediminicola]|uniref:Copper-binding protein n=1 Tax=Roseibium sediminicola TaxID=2933272 RepID=A0ABT0GWA3_9HYPH|nr:copper-binding protein [Roseibium sp. CAU 1639]MCK7613733.1 copper-binding protein [Roseibium sp. CAU 1639]
MKTLTLLAFLSLAMTPAALAQSSHGMDHSNMPMSGEQIEGAVHAQAVVNSIGDGTANVSHDPIPEIGWPAMTMDLTVLEGAQMMGGINAGDTVTLMLVKGDDGMYAIGAIMPN